MQSNKDLPIFSWSVFIWEMLILFALILSIYCLIDIIKKKTKGNKKAIWILIIIFIPIIGAILYIAKGKKTF